MLSFKNLQKGQKYYMRNYGEETTFVVVEILENGDCIVKHTETLEIFHLHDLTRYGKGTDYELHEES
jgi:hypothetical protein